MGSESSGIGNGVGQDLKKDQPEKIEKALVQKVKKLFAKFPLGVKT